MNITIRNELEKDYRATEELTRAAFWNVHVPGCDEHYLVHVMRNHPDFVPGLNFVAIVEHQIVGNIMYAKSRLINEENFCIDTLTFGPVSVLPEMQKKGIGSALIQHSIKKAVADGYKAIVIEGHPYNYCKHGFVGAKSVNVSNSEGRHPYSLLVLELDMGCLQGHAWKYYPSEVYNLNENMCKEYDCLFPAKEKGFKPSQEEFRIASNAYVE